MKERPILFSAPMVRALLEGRKTVTRRIVKVQPEKIPEDVWQSKKHGNGYWWGGMPARYGIMIDVPNMAPMCPYGVPGDRLWVRERMRVLDIVGAGGQPGAHAIRVQYEADRATSEWISYPDRLIGRPVACKCLAYGGFREASRLSLEITGVKVERLQDITEDQARAEGVGPLRADGRMQGGSSVIDAFADLWESINGAGSWDLNPWIWAVSFKRVTP